MSTAGDRRGAHRAAAPAGRSVVQSPDAELEGELGQAQHRIPVIDKMMQVLEQLEGEVDGSNISEIERRTRLPRSTIYRMLNTLVDHGIVMRVGGNYALGFRLVSLAAGVPSTLALDDVLRIARPRLTALAAATGETCKLSVLQDERALVVDVAQSPREIAPHSRVGSAFPLHAGAASKLLLAHAGEAVIARVLAAPREAHTPATIVDADALAAELEQIRSRGLSFDRGEWNPNIHAVAAPVFGADRRILCAASITYFPLSDEADVEQRIARPLASMCAGLSRVFGLRG